MRQILAAALFVAVAVPSTASAAYCTLRDHEYQTPAGGVWLKKCVW